MNMIACAEHENCPERAKWEQARTIADLGELVSLWLERRITWNPNYGGGEHGTAEEETTSLVPVLAALNRAGFATTFSQPGTIEWMNADAEFEYDGHRYPLYDPAALDRWQRAVVFGMLDHDRLDMIRGLYAHCTESGLRVTAWIGADPGYSITNADFCFYGALGGRVRVADDFAHASGGFVVRLSTTEIRDGSWSYPAGLRDALDSAIYVTVEDPEVGRDSVMWKTLRAWNGTSLRSEVSV